jgi:hypothetical protein
MVMSIVVTTPKHKGEADKTNLRSVCVEMTQQVSVFRWHGMYASTARNICVGGTVCMCQHTYEHFFQLGKFKKFFKVLLRKFRIGDQPISYLKKKRKNKFLLLVLEILYASQVLARRKKTFRAKKTVTWTHHHHIDMDTPPPGTTTHTTGTQ